MVGNNLNDVQLQQLVDRTIIKADTDFDGKISFEEFCTVSLYNRTNRGVNVRIRMNLTNSSWKTLTRNGKVENAVKLKVQKEYQNKCY